jgi:hypothetical protein
MTGSGQIAGRRSSGEPGEFALHHFAPFPALLQLWSVPLRVKWEGTEN